MAAVFVATVLLAPEVFHISDEGFGIQLFIELEPAVVIRLLPSGWKEQTNALDGPNAFAELSGFLDLLVRKRIGAFDANGRIDVKGHFEAIGGKVTVDCARHEVVVNAVGFCEGMSFCI